MAALDDLSVSKMEESSQTTLAGIDTHKTNASGHLDQLPKQYGLWGVIGIAVAINNPWVVLGSSMSVGILNGGPPGVIYGLLIAVVYYFFITLSVAELTSSLPTSGGVYHWASITAGPRHGRIVGFFTGWINLFSLLFGLASLVQIAACAAVELYTTYHTTFTPKPWHTYIAYLVLTALSMTLIIFANSVVPLTQKFGMILIVAGGLATIIALAVMPTQHATTYFVWASFDENNLTGWNGGVAFLVGVLNGAFTVGTTDSVTHVAEEVRDASRNLPRAMIAQLGVALVYGLAFAIVLGYAIPDLSTLADGSTVFPLAAIYRRATGGSTSACFMMLLIVFLLAFCSVVGALLTTSRTCWALARDDALPLSSIFGRVNLTRDCPVEATLVVSILTAAIGAIPLGSSAGFTNLTGSFIILSTASYAIPIVCNLKTRRQYWKPGCFCLGKFGSLVNYTTIFFILVFDIMFCFPPTLPVSPSNMSYNSVILCGVVFVTSVWWFASATRQYRGPLIMRL